MTPPQVIVRHVALGLAAGAIISIVPLELGILVVPGLVVVWILALKRRPSGAGIATYLTAAGLALVVVTVAIALPVKQLDGKVPAVSYAHMSLDDLGQVLRRDWRVFVNTPFPEGTNIFLEFRTVRPMTRREILQKLADDTGCDLRVGYCASGTTFLFGSHPSFTRLKVKGAQPDGAANRSQPVRPEENQTSAAAGSGR